MCEPASITAGAALLSTGLSIVSSVSKNQQQEAVAAGTQDNANRALAQSYNATATRYNNAADKNAVETFDVTRSMAEAKGQAAASAGESGTAGVSFANVLSSVETKMGRAKGKADYEYASEIGAANAEAFSNSEKTKAIIASTPRPSRTGMFAEIGGAATKAGLKIYEAFSDRDSGANPDKNIDSEIASWSQYH